MEDGYVLSKIDNLLSHKIAYLFHLPENAIEISLECIILIMDTFGLKKSKAAF